MRINKAFTLNELLTVIALITTPIILGIINDSKQHVFKDTTCGLIKATHYNYIETMYKGETPVNIVFTYTNGVPAGIYSFRPVLVAGVGL